MHVAIT